MNLVDVGCGSDRSSDSVYLISPAITQFIAMAPVLASDFGRQRDAR